MYESNDGGFKSIFMLLDKSTNSSFKYEEFEYLNSLQAQMYEESPDFDDLINIEYNSTMLMD